MLNEQSLTDAGLTSCERGRVEELGFVARRLREIVAEAGGRSVDPKALEQWADVLDFRCEHISAMASAGDTGGKVHVVLGAPTCLYGNSTFDDDGPMPPALVERPARTLEKAASDVAVAASSLFGLQSDEYVEILAELADELVKAARCLREMSEGMEDGDE